MIGRCVRPYDEMRNKPMRVLQAAVLMLLVSGPGAGAAEWISREGECGEWRGLWRVEQEQPGLWVGEINYEQIGGRCKDATGQRARSQVRVAIIGNDFFAVRDGPLNFYGPIRDGRVRGEITGGGAPNLFTIRMAGPASAQPQQRRPSAADSEDMDEDDSMDQRPSIDPRNGFRGGRR